MDWWGVVAIVLSCVMAIHMGLIDAILKTCKMDGMEIPIIRCPKCLSFHCVLWFLIITGHKVIYGLAAAFLASYVAIWLDLLFGLIDCAYEDLYNRISEGDNTSEVHHKDNRQSTGEDNPLP